MEGNWQNRKVVVCFFDETVGKYWYKVKDEGHGEEYTIDLSDVTNPCSCHQPKWQKLPCVHVIRVLNWREEFWRVGICWKGVHNWRTGEDVRLLREGGVRFPGVASQLGSA